VSQGVQAAEPTVRCDHICLLDDGHVERGEPHFYGYEHPSPRITPGRCASTMPEIGDVLLGCSLPAGHAGMHHDNSGVYWVETQ
jgi:hypothetical protein